MIGIILNGELSSVESGTSIEELVATLLSSPRGVAVAIGRSVIPRSEWSTTSLEDGAVVEIVTAVAGGSSNWARLGTWHHTKSSLTHSISGSSRRCLQRPRASRWSDFSKLEPG